MDSRKRRIIGTSSERDLDSLAESRDDEVAEQARREQAARVAAQKRQQETESGGS